MEKMPYRPELDRQRRSDSAPSHPRAGRQHGLARPPADARGRHGHAARAARVGCRVAVCAADDRRSVAIHLAGADHGRRLRAVHRLDVASAPRRLIRLLRGDDRLRPTRRSASSSCGSWNPASVLRSGDSRSGRRTGESGVFMEGAELIVDFAFDTVGVHRLEARATVRNGRGNGALRKIGAVQEGLLRKSFQKTANISTRRCGPSSTRTGERRRSGPRRRAVIIH